VGASGVGQRLAVVPSGGRDHAPHRPFSFEKPGHIDQPTAHLESTAWSGVLMLHPGGRTSHRLQQRPPVRRRHRHVLSHYLPCGLKLGARDHSTSLSTQPLTNEPEDAPELIGQERPERPHTECQRRTSAFGRIDGSGVASTLCTVTLRDCLGRLRAAPDGRQRADSSDRQQPGQAESSLRRPGRSFAASAGTSTDGDVQASHAAPS
jgi:hypothetical protein